MDDEIEGGEWVTVENLYKHISGGNGNNLMDNEDNLLFVDGKEAGAEEEQDSENKEQSEIVEENKDKTETKEKES